jgi:uncharacterized lipoprotein NlpE involved in copper resistance
MKTPFFAVIATMFSLSALFSCKTANNSPANNASESLPDWAGVYTGITPGANAEIDVKITLDTGGLYALEYRYIGKGDDVFTNTGKFSWNPEKNTVILGSEREGDFPTRYKVGENTLTQLDLAGNVITGELADKYILKKRQ